MPTRFPTPTECKRPAPAVAQPVERDTVVLESMVIGLHALAFGVASSKSAEDALAAVSDGGVIHEYIHAMVRLLPDRTGPDAHPPAGQKD